MTKAQKTDKAATIHKSRRYFKVLVVLIAIGGLVPLGYLGYVYATSPGVIRNPKFEHYHFRMQVIVDGKAEDFGKPAYQEGYAKDNCNALLTEHPIHFHDRKDQMVHIHWNGMTGGLVMKYYGWNFVGGRDSSLGYKLDKLTDPQDVPIHGRILPDIPEGAKFYVYSGDERSYKERSFGDWKSQDLEVFFNKRSNLPGNETDNTSAFMKVLLPTAAAHGTEDHSVAGSDHETQEQRLTRINNLIGNVVIFVQKDRPSDKQVKERFNDLEPLSDSTCGG